MHAPTVFGSLRGYQRAWVSSDVIAGLTVWAVLVPEALAYATIAGVSPVIGLYAAPPALVLYALFGSSKHLVTGPMSATAALSATAIAAFATAGSDDFVALTTALAVVTGVIALLAGLAHLGFLANFISEPVIKGFIIGMALTIIIGQVPKLLGIEGGGEDFFEKLGEIVRHLGDTSLVTLAVGLASLAVVLAIRRWLPVVPGSLVAVVLGVLAVSLFDLDDHGVAIVGHIDSGLPSFGLPDVAARDYLGLAGAAAGIALVGFAEGLGAAKTYAAREHYPIDASRELVGLGAANLGAGLSSGMVVNGSLSKTAVNGSAGARSQVSGLVVAALTIVTLLFLTGLFENLPEATLAAVVIAAVIELVDIETLLSFRRAWTTRIGRIYGVAARPDFIAAVAALVGVLVFDTLPGLFIGIVASLLLLVYRAAHPHVAVLGRLPGSDRFGDVDRYDDAAEVPGVVVLRPETGLFFANAEVVANRIRDEVVRRDAHAVVLDAQTVPSIDISAIRVLDGLADDLERGGVRFAIARDIGQVRDVMAEVAREQTVQRVFPTVRAAVAALADDGPPGDGASAPAREPHPGTRDDVDPGPDPDIGPSSGR